jgi:hypothetical protein
MRGTEMEKDACVPLTKACFRQRFLFLLITILAMLIIAPFLEGFVGLRILLDSLMSVVFISGIYAISQKKHHIVIASLLALPMLVSVWSKYVAIIPVVTIVGNLCGAAFFAFLIVNILIYIYRQQEVSRDMIAGAAVVYLLMALGWSFLYRTIEQVHPGSFSVPDLQLAQEQLSFLYFSFVTISTLGYGDVTPVTSLASTLSVLEAITGQLYLVVQVAWLVGVHVSQSMEKRSR